MAESTSAAANPNNIQCYDVFINHRGTDVKETFAKNLYERLDSEGLRVFLDRPELEAGDTIISQIENAIATASVQVAIFSPGYAESKWCLNELLSMLDRLERGAKVIPVFYEVEPADLRKARGNVGLYGKAFCDFESNPRYNAGEIEKWRGALCKAADISGYELKACKGGETELLDKVVECTLKKVQLKRLDVADYPTGLGDKIRDFESKISAKGKVVGIVGLGGVGKTTLVKEFFHGMRSQYRRNCFLRDIRTSSSLLSLQKELLQSLTGSDLKIDNIDAGKTELKKHLSTDKALVVLDDVDKVSQVNALLPIGTVFHSDSLILITSRDTNVLTSSVVEDSLIYPLTGLNPRHSKELFCWHSFNQDRPRAGFESLVDEFLEVCDGLPLSLVVIGALLRGNGDNLYWREQLEKLHTVPDEIKQKLKISYDALAEDEREMFLDIACFFARYNRDTAMRIWDGIWDGTGWNCWLGFHKLQSSYLVRVDSENGIQMHDHLRDMGRDIAKDMEGRLPHRLWRWTDDVIVDLLQRTSNGQRINVRGIRMDLSDYNKHSDAFGYIDLRRLQLLDTEKDILEHIINWVKLPNLKWLRWNECPYPALPSWSLMYIRNLRVLQLSGSTLKTLWAEESQAPSKLRELEIYGPLRNIPKSIGRLKHLERIVVGRFSNIGRVNLIELPEEFCELESLKALVLKECSRLQSLPHSFGKLTTLEHIDLSLCRNLETLPDSFGSLKKLEHIDLSNCYDLWSLPDSFGCLENLQRIFLQGCHQLKRLPDYFGNLKKLQHINLSDCHGLTELPESFGGLSKLEYINFSGCHNLKSLPDSFGNLTNLQRINLSNCYDLETLPDCFDNLKNLQDIDLSKCHSLERLPNSLRNRDKSNILCLEGCSSLTM